MGSFEEECDRLARMADPSGHERAEWNRTGGKVLDDTVALVKAAFDDRPDLQVTDTKAEEHKRALTLATRSEPEATPIVTINFAVSSRQVVIWATTIPESGFRVAFDKHHYPTNGPADEKWVRSVLRDLLASVNKVP